MPITLADIEPSFDLPVPHRNVELLYISATELDKNRPTVLNLYFKVEGALTLSDANVITSSLMSRLNIRQYDTFISFANHPWFVQDTGFPIRDPLIYAEPISHDQALQIGSIGCSSLAGSVHCSGPFGQPGAGLDGR